MYYPRFTKAIIHHFITKGNLISMRNKMFMHTTEDDSILGPMRFVSKADNYQVYGALLPEKERKFKKHASPSRKRTLVTVEEEEHEPGGSSDGTGSKSGVPDEPKGKSIDMHEGTGLKPRVPNMSKTDSSESEYESWGDSGDEANVQGDDEDVQDDDEHQQDDDKRTDYENQETNDDKEESDDEFIHTPPNYVPTDDETNDEFNDVDEEEYDRIDKELYGDVNDSLTDVEQEDGDEEDEDMINATHVQVEQTQEETTGIQEESGLEMASVQVLESKTLSAIHQRITDLEKDVKELKSVDNSTIMIQKHSADIIKEHSVPAEIVERLKQQYATQKSIEDIQKIKMEHARKQQVPKETITSSDTAAHKEFDQKITLFNTMTKSKSFNKIPKHRALYQALMELILEDEDAMDKGVADELKKRKPDEADKDVGPSVGSDRGLKRQRKSKGTKTSKKMSATKNSFKGKSSSTSSKSSKSVKSAKDHVVEPISVQDSDNAEYDDADYAYMLMDQGEDLGNTNEQPNDEVVPKNDWYKKSKSDTSLDPEWNEGKSVDDEPEQSWLNNMAKDTKPPLTFDDLMHTLIDFSAFAMNCLKIYNLTKELLVGPVYNLLKGTCKSYVELDYTMEECYRALSAQLDWNNPEGHCCPYDLTKTLPMQMSSQGRQIIPANFFFNNELEYLRG
ncbi:hypothetical protein Tco_0777625 [Tanacetum coccineum]